MFDNISSWPATRVPAAVVPLLLAGECSVSDFGTYITLLALQTLVVLVLHGSAAEVGCLNSVRWLPVLDMGSRRIVGFAVGEHHDADLAEAALQMAVAVRGGKAAIIGVIMHTDQGSEYTAGTFQTACGRCDITQSMGRVGSALDNAVIESWHSTLEFELRQLEHFATKAQARRRLATWIEEYNHERRHSSLAMRSPIDYELPPRR